MILSRFVALSVSLILIIHYCSNSWAAMTNVYPSYSGYSSMTVVPQPRSNLSYSLGLAYNRGWDGDGCRGDACPYSTVISYADVPVTSPGAEPAEPDEGASDEQPSPPQDAVSHDAKNGSGLLSLGWWRNRTHFPPDSPGLFYHNKIIVQLDDDDRRCTDPASCSVNFTKAFLAADEQRLLNGSTLHSFSDLVRFGRETHTTFVFADVHRHQSPVLQAVIASADCYMRHRALDGESTPA